jgi:hypothetical protein
LKWTAESPHSTHFEGITFEKTEQGGRIEDFKYLDFWAKEHLAGRTGKEEIDRRS